MTASALTVLDVETPFEAFAPQPRRTSKPTVLAPPATAAAADRDFEEFRRNAPDVGVSGVHPNAVVALLGLYGVLMLSFWLFFGGPATALTLTVITVLGLMYFGMLGAGILVSDSPPPGERGRDFGEFLNGRVLTFTGWISGTEALWQIIALPAALSAGAVVFGAIWRFTAG
jgi:hypothetical protein